MKLSKWEFFPELYLPILGSKIIPCLRKAAQVRYLQETNVKIPYEYTSL